MRDASISEACTQHYWVFVSYLWYSCSPVLSLASQNKNHRQLLLVLQLTLFTNRSVKYLIDWALAQTSDVAPWYNVAQTSFFLSFLFKLSESALPIQTVFPEQFRLLFDCSTVLIWPFQQMAQHIGHPCAVWAVCRGCFLMILAPIEFLVRKVYILIQWHNSSEDQAGIQVR